MPEYEYALQEEKLSTGEKRIVLFWTPDLEQVKNRYKTFIRLDEVNVSYGGSRTYKYRIVERPVPAPTIIVWEESW